MPDLDSSLAALARLPLTPEASAWCASWLSGAVAGYQAGLAKAGEAAQAIDDLATLRRAAAILTKVSR